MATSPAPTSTLTAALYGRAGQYGPTPDAVAVSAFAGWPLSAQAALVRAYGMGSPLAVLVGPAAGPQAIATLDARGTAVTVTPAPAGLDTAPKSLDTATFLRWPNEAQLFYVQTNGAGDPASLDIGDPRQATLTVTESYGQATGVSVTTAAALAVPATQTLDTTAFFALPPDQQAAYVQTHVVANSSPPTANLLGAGAGGTTIPLMQAGQAYAVTVPAGTYPGFATALTAPSGANAGAPKMTSAVPKAVFDTWPDAVQRAYVATGDTSAGYPKLVYFPGAKQIVSVAAKGADTETSAAPPQLDGTATAATASQVMGWTPMAQLFYARTWVATGTATFLNGTSTTVALSMTLAGGGSGVTLSSTPPDPLPAPADLDLNLFALWTTAEQAAYLTTNATGTPPSVVLGRDAYVLAADARGVPAVSAFPADFGTAPANLAPTAFLAWSPAFRALYTARNGALVDVAQPGSQTPLKLRQVTIGAAGGPQATATIAQGGTLLVSGGLYAIDPTIGMSLPNPAQNIYGSDVGLSLDPNRTSAETLFPTLDGTAGRTIANKTAEVAKQVALAPAALDPNDFGTWNSAIQLEYLRKYGDPSKGYALTVGPGTSNPPGTLTAFIGTTGTKVYIADTLQKTDITKMPLADQTVLAGLMGSMPSLATLATSLGLITDKVAAEALVTKVADGIRNNTLLGGNSGMPAADKQVFLDELAILTTKVDAGAVFSVKDITDQANEIQQRFERANCFAVPLYQPNATAYATGDFRGQSGMTVTYDDSKGLSDRLGSAGAASDYAGSAIWVNGTPVSPALTLQDIVKIPAGSASPFTYVFPTPLTVPGPNGTTQTLTDWTARGANGETLRLKSITLDVTTHRAVSTDGNVGIAQGYATFMAQEKQLLNLAQNRQRLADTGTLAGGTQKLDVPNLIYLFQLYANLAGEAKIRADAEEINQTNAFLKTYNVLQNLINNTVKAINGDADHDHGLTGTAAGGGLTKEENAVKEMFSTGSAAPPAPIELLKGISRPYDGFGDRRGTSWSTFGQQLSDKVTLINQEAQIKMNDVNSATKAKDRNFDLANNALTKMNEIVQKIAGAI